MQKVISLILGFAAMGWSAIGALTIPHEIDSAAIPKVIYIDQNNDSIINRVNEIKDTVNGLAAGTAAFSGLTASRLMSTNASKQPASVSDLTSWIAGTANQITSTSDGDGTLTLSLPSAVTMPGTLAATRLNLNSAVDNASFPLNVIGSIANSGTNGIFSYGSGVPGDANYERAGIIHTGSAAEFRSNASGTGTVENLRLVLGSTTRYEITNAGEHTATGKLTGSDSVVATLGLRVGSDITMYRQGANLLRLGDSLVVDGRLAVAGKASITDSVVGGHLKTVSGNLIVGGTGAVTGAMTAASIALGGNEAFTYNEDTYTGTLTGVSGTVTGTVRWARMGSIVVLQIDVISGTSTGVTATITGMPAEIRPVRDQQGGVGACTNNGAVVQGQAFVKTTGTIEFYPLALGATPGFPGLATWTGSGTKSIGYSGHGFVVTYNLL